MAANLWDENLEVDEDKEILGGTNFLVHAIELLKKQKKQLAEENVHLKARLMALETQNAAFINLTAERLLEKRG